jgi:hypothetical protein
MMQSPGHRAHRVHYSRRHSLIGGYYSLWRHLRAWRKIRGRPVEKRERRRSFAALLPGWLRRTPAQREELIESLGSSDFHEVAKFWLKPKAGREPSDLRQERRVFIEALSAASEREISPSTFYDIVNAVECLAINPMQSQDRKIRNRKIRKSIEDAQKQTTEVMRAVQLLRDALKKFKPTPEGWVHVEDWPLYGFMGRLQRILGETVLVRALEKAVLPPAKPSELIVRALSDLDQHLEQCLQWEWPNGRPPNEDVHAFLRELFRIFAGLGGRLEALWNTDKEHPKSPLAKFLTVIYLSLPHDLQQVAGPTPSAFVATARRLLSRKGQSA